MKADVFKSQIYGWKYFHTHRNFALNVWFLCTQDSARDLPLQQSVPRPYRKTLNTEFLILPEYLEIANFKTKSIVKVATYLYRKISYLFIWEQVWNNSLTLLWYIAYFYYAKGNTSPRPRRAGAWCALGTCIAYDRFGNVSFWSGPCMWKIKLWSSMAPWLAADTAARCEGVGMGWAGIAVLVFRESGYTVWL